MSLSCRFYRFFQCSTKGNMNMTHRFVSNQNKAAAAMIAHPGNGSGSTSRSTTSTNGCRRFSASTTQSAPSQIYELRVYRTNMIDFRTVVEMFEQNIHLRTNHSELMGFWTAEIGESIHEVVHIWKYDSLGHRLKVRTSLAGDPTWQSNFIAKFTPKVQYMLSSLMAPVPGTSVSDVVQKDPTAVYTLQRVVQGSPAPAKSQGEEQLVGRFLGVLGENNIEFRLWRYGNIDAACDASLQKAVENKGSVSTTLLYPTKFSPLQ